MTSLPQVTDANARRAPRWHPIVTPVVATLAIGAAALTAFAFVTIFLLFAGGALAAFLLWRASGLIPRRPRPGGADITGPRPYTVHMRPSAQDQRAFDAFVDARAKPRD